MKIKDLQINGFGKLSNKKIELDEKINVIYGKNEAGKSTLLGFISSIFFGASKTKNGKEISDFEKYTPWNSDNFSGKISYELDNGENYEVFRDFKKKNPVIYDNNKQDISLSFPIDKTKGIDYIYNQINLDEETFKNTVIIAQNDVKINKSAQNGIIQKISNIVSSGDENISFKKTLEKINKSQIENVGTDRTREKPINIVKEKIEKLKKSKEKIENYKDFLIENDSNVQEIQDKIDDEETKLLLYRVIKENNQKSKIKKSEIEVITNIRDENIEKIDELDEKIDKNIKADLKNKKKSLLFPIISILGFIIASVVCFLLKLNIIIPISLIGVSILIFIIDAISRAIFNKNKKKKIQELDELEKSIEKEIAILKDNIKARQSEIDKKQSEIKEAENEINRIVMNDFEYKLDSDFIENAFELSDEVLENNINEKNDTINNLKIEKGAKQGQKDLMQKEIGDLSKVQEQLDRLEDEKKDLELLNNSYNIAKEGLENAYENIRNSLSPKFTNKLCEIASKISNEKYSEISFNDTDGLVVRVEDGRFIPVERLSQGTIDQMYLGLRLATIDTIINENMPIILDETFAFFDDDRLKNILNFINDNYSDKQVIICTCSKREIEGLNRLNVDYNYVELEN